VSVLPSATEIVCALGAREQLVGRSAECDFPPDVASVPVVMRARTLDAERPSAEIDARVRAARSRDESLYVLEVDRLRAAAPDLLLTQDLCGVCSVTEAEVTRACNEAGVHPTIVSLSPRNLGEVWASIETVGKAIDRGGEAGRLARELRRRASPPPGPSVGRVAVVEWLDPPILAGLWAAEMVVAAGGTPVGPSAGEPGARTDWGHLARLSSDLVVLSPCSFSVDRTRRELEDLTLAREVGASSPARGTFVADEAYFSRPGPRLAEGVDLLRTLLRGNPPQGPMPVVRWNAPPLEAGS